MSWAKNNKPGDVYMAGNKNRDSEFYRDERAKHIARKKKIIKEQNNYWYYEHEGELSKGKIHCSCWLCRHKSYDYPKIQDVRNKLRLNSSLKEYTTGEMEVN